MASSYSTSLKLELIGNGDQSGTWGNTTNNNLGTLLEQAITGVRSITMLNADYVLTSFNGTSDESRNAVIVASGTNSAIRQIVAPLVNKLYVVTNNTSGGYAITIGGVSGSTVSIPNGVTAQVYCNGTNFFSSQTGSAGNFTVNGTLTATGLTDTGNMSVGGTLGVTGATSLTTGSISGVMTAPTAAAGTNTTQLATTAFVTQNAVQTGTINMWPTASAPTGYLLCAGAAVSRTTYAALFAVISTTFGAGDGSTTFNLPNYTNRMPYGTTIGATGGSADAVVVSHTHTASVTDPGHSHVLALDNIMYAYPYGYGANVRGDYGAVHAALIASPSTNSATTSISVSNSTTGVSGTNANLPPYLGINFIIKT
jgi:microcystin-dependent protein